MVAISGVSNYQGLKISRSSCIENSTPQSKEMEIWFKLSWVRVTEVIL